MMQQRVMLCCLLGLCIGMATSCSDIDRENEDDRLIIEPPYLPMFQFDEQGIPFRWESPTLSTEMQRNVREEVIGHGWKWMQTFEILNDGHVKPEDYYKEMIGTSPTSYYIKSDKELVRYFWTDAVPAKAFLAQEFKMDAETGVLSDGYNPSGIRPWTFYLHIWSIYELSGRWYMDTIEPLGMRGDKNGEFKIVWGSSHYYRMNDDELRQMQKEHCFDYSQVN